MRSGNKNSLQGRVRRDWQNGARPLSKTEDFGTNKDGSRNTDYCAYCYKDGEFTSDMTLDEMIEELRVAYMAYMEPDETREFLRKQFSSLKRWICVFMFLLFSSEAIGQEWKESVLVEKVFNDASVRGAFVLYDISDDIFVCYNRARAKTRFVPASTFKIANTLIGLLAGSVKDVDEVLPWGGASQPVEAWEKDMSLRDAIKISNVPIYQELARRIDLETMLMGVGILGYGNKEIGAVIDRFWLDGPLKISAVEQVRFLKRLALNELPFPDDIQASTREILKLEGDSGYSLFAKTGTASCYDPDIGWWVGWVEKAGRIYAFALNMDLVAPDDSAKRISVGRECLRTLGLLD
jgi:beta-lactamase class D